MGLHEIGLFTIFKMTLKLNACKGDSNPTPPTILLLTIIACFCEKFGVFDILH